MSETLSSGLTLTIPSEGDSNWATSIKNDCFQKISEHDHTGGGKGVQIGTSAIANLAVTAAKIADTTITAAKIADATITEAKLADDAATRSCLLLEAGRSIADGSASIVNLQRDVFSWSSSGINVVKSAMPKAGKVTHLTVALQSNIVSGSVIITLYKNGATTGKGLTLSSGATNTGSIVAESFAAGDTLTLCVTTAAVTLGGGGLDVVIANAWGHFTE